ncbi:MAG: ferrochelatase [Bdellovibrionales bacterium]|nr:ferrochelatase [Bdellovibrionales bacterium]
MDHKKQTLVILLNLGSTRSPTPHDVGQYLTEFLMDPMVIDRPWFWRFLLVRGLIVPFRKKKTAQAYSSIWTPQGSPLIFLTKELAEGLSQKMGEQYHVDWVMRYGQPHLKEKIIEWEKKTWKEIIFVPLYPHLTKSSFGTAETLFKKFQHRLQGPVKIVKPFFSHAAYINALTQHIKSYYIPGKQNHLLFSFHSLPVRHLTEINSVCANESSCCIPLNEKNKNCYRAQCFATAQSVAQKLQLPPENWSVSFQSRLGREPWLTPATPQEMHLLIKKGVANLFVHSPSFIVDGLETLEELEIRAKKDFESAPSRTFTFIPCLNSNPQWIDALKQIILSHENEAQ